LSCDPARAKRARYDALARPVMILAGGKLLATVFDNDAQGKYLPL
jgi:hypothetical protein